MSEFRFRHVIFSVMANKDDRYQENALGKFFVDTQCIDCDVCRVTAPANFTRQEDKGFSFVMKQAETTFSDSSLIAHHSSLYFNSDSERLINRSENLIIGPDAGRFGRRHD